MHIPCESCGTTYDLDPQLLPPGGAPVQCTRCGHVFIAFPPGADPAQLSSESAPAVDRPKTSDFPIPTLESGALAPRAEQSLPPSSGQTFMFSVPREVLAPEPVAAQQRASTQMFAAPPVASAQRASTPEYGEIPDPFANGSETPMFPEPEQSQPRASVSASAVSAERPTTQMFAAPIASAPRPTTQMFAAPIASAPRPTTQMFAAPPGDSGSAERSVPASPSRSSSGQRGSTEMFPSKEGSASPAGPSSVSLPELSAPTTSTRVRPAAVRLPAEPMPLGFELNEGAHAADRSEENRRRNLGIFGAVVFMILLILAGGLLAPRLFADRSTLSPEAFTARAEAIRLTRKDDAASRAEARVKLDSLIASTPGYLEARANRVMLSALDVDDLQMEMRRLGERGRHLAHLSSNFRTLRTPSDWENRVNAIEDERLRGSARLQSLEKRAQVLLSQLERDVAALAADRTGLSLEEELSLAALEALMFAVRGDSRARELAERYRLKGGSEGWDVLAEATYAANATAMAPATVAEIRRMLQALQAKDPGFLRAFILSARLALVQKDAAAAKSAIENVATFNPSHSGVALLSPWVADLESR